MIPYSTKTRTKAIDLRKKGKSYSQIAKKLNLGKSTVGFWLKNIAIGKTKLSALKPVKTLKLKFKHQKKYEVKKKK